jgi:hypothetical protein
MDVGAVHGSTHPAAMTHAAINDHQDRSRGRELNQSALFRALRAGQIVGDDALIAAVWPGQAPADGDIHALRVLVHQLCDALEIWRWRIARHRQRGYRLEHVLAV